MDWVSNPAQLPELLVNFESARSSIAPTSEIELQEMNVALVEKVEEVSEREGQREEGRIPLSVDLRQVEPGVEIFCWRGWILFLGPQGWIQGGVMEFLGQSSRRSR